LVHDLAVVDAYRLDARSRRRWHATGSESEVSSRSRAILKGVEMSGTVDKAKGRIKEAAGALTGDRKLKREGQVDQAAGDVKDAADRVVERVKNSLNR